MLSKHILHHLQNILNISQLSYLSNIIPLLSQIPFRSSSNSDKSQQNHLIVVEFFYLKVNKYMNHLQKDAAFHYVCEHYKKKKITLKYTRERLTVNPPASVSGHVTLSSGPDRQFTPRSFISCYVYVSEQKRSSFVFVALQRKL